RSNEADFFAGNSQGILVSSNRGDVRRNYRGRDGNCPQNTPNTQNAKSPQRHGGTKRLNHGKLQRRLVQRNGGIWHNVPVRQPPRSKNYSLQKSERGRPQQYPN